MRDNLPELFKFSFQFVQAANMAAVDHSCLFIV